jgi:hypothetical protein
VSWLVSLPVQFFRQARWTTEGTQIGWRADRPAGAARAARGRAADVVSNRRQTQIIGRRRQESRFVAGHEARHEWAPVDICL